MFITQRPLPPFNGLYTPFGSPVPGGQEPLEGRRFKTPPYSPHEGRDIIVCLQLLPSGGKAGKGLLYHLVRYAVRIALRKRICKNRPNAPVIGIRVGLSVVAVQVEIAVVVPIHVEPITGRELATPQTRMLPVHILYLGLSQVGNPYSFLSALSRKP